MVALEQGCPVVVLATPIGQNKIGPQGPLRHVAGGGPRPLWGPALGGPARRPTGLSCPAYTCGARGEGRGHVCRWAGGRMRGGVRMRGGRRAHAAAGGRGVDKGRNLGSSTQVSCRG